MTSKMEIHKRIRAISPAIATIALIGVAIAAVGGVAAFAISKSSALKQDLSADILEAHVVQMRKGTCEWSFGWTTKNTGSVPITYIEGRIRQDSGVDWWYNVVPPGWASPGSTQRASADGCVSITPGRSYTVLVVAYSNVGTGEQSQVYSRTIVAEGL